MRTEFEEQRRRLLEELETYLRHLEHVKKEAARARLPYEEALDLARTYMKMARDLIEEPWQRQPSPQLGKRRRPRRIERWRFWLPGSRGQRDSDETEVSDIESQVD